MENCGEGHLWACSWGVSIWCYWCDFRDGICIVHSHQKSRQTLEIRNKTHINRIYRWQSEGDNKWKRQWSDSKNSGLLTIKVVEWRKILEFFNKGLEVFPKAICIKILPSKTFGAWTVLPVEAQSWATLTSDTSASTMLFRKGIKETSNQILESTKTIDWSWTKVPGDTLYTTVYNPGLNVPAFGQTMMTRKLSESPSSITFLRPYLW